MNRYMPLTGHDSTVPALLIDTQAPLDVLHDAAVHRIQAVTQLLENLAFRDQLSSDAVVLQEIGAQLGCLTSASRQRTAPCAASVHAHEGLVALATAEGAKTLLFTTWARDERTQGRINRGMRQLAKDTGATVDAASELSRVPPHPEMPELMRHCMRGEADAAQARRFGELWQQRVARILLEHWDDPEVFQLSAVA